MIGQYLASYIYPAMKHKERSVAYDKWAAGGGVCGGDGGRGGRAEDSGIACNRHGEGGKTILMWNY